MNTTLPPLWILNRIPRPPPYRPKPKQPLTIAIGFICRDGIVLASDSQHTYTTSASAKRTDAQKISPIDFQNSNALIVESGSVALSKRFVEIFQEMAAPVRIANKRTVPDMAEQAMRALKNQLRAQNGDCSMAELKEQFMKEGTDMECIFAHHVDGEPQLHTISFAMSIAEKVKSHYIAVGCGASLGEYLLDTHLDPKRDQGFCAIVAVHVIETVKKYDAFCGGRTHVASLISEIDGTARVSYISELNQDTVETYINGLTRTAVPGSVMRDHYNEAIADDIIRLVKEKKKKRR